LSRKSVGQVADLRRTWKELTAGMGDAMAGCGKIVRFVAGEQGGTHGVKAGVSDIEMLALKE